MTELHYAAYCGDHDGVLAALRKGLDVNGRDHGGWTPLHWVVDMGMVAGEREHIVATLVRAGADVNAHDRAGATPLMVACRAGNGELVRQLVAAGADLNARDNAGKTALIEARVIASTSRYYHPCSAAYAMLLPTRALCRGV
jgi:ankyrin repeat protein